MTVFELPEGVGMYMSFVFIASVAIRAILSLLRFIERLSPWKRINSWRMKYSFWRIFRGFGADETIDDFCLPAIVGFLELSVYPVLLAAGKPQYIVAWLGLKVIPIFGRWTTHRETYQRFLIGNALAIIASYFLQTWFYMHTSYF